jgi:hypothetical protein
LAGRTGILYNFYPNPKQKKQKKRKKQRLKRLQHLEKMLEERAHSEFVTYAKDFKLLKKLTEQQ